MSLEEDEIREILTDFFTMMQERGIWFYRIDDNESLTRLSAATMFRLRNMFIRSSEVDHKVRMHL